MSKAELLYNVNCVSIVEPMKNLKRHPSDPLIAKYIDCYWLIEKTYKSMGLDHPKLNPDPAAHLILSPKNQAYNYQFNDVEIKGVGCHLILPNTSTIKLDHSKPFIIFGIKFHVGAIYSLKFGESFPLSNSIVTNLDFLPVELHSAQHSGFFCDAVSQFGLTCEELDKKLLPWIQNRSEDRHSELVRKVIYMLENASPSELANKLYCSKRTIERAFRRVTGITLKQYESMVMLEALLNYLYKNQETPLSWADISAQFGFNDQSHLIRHLKARIGSTPSEYLKRRDITIDVYGDFE